MFCPNCGNRVYKRAKICRTCQFRLVKKPFTAPADRSQRLRRAAVLTAAVLAAVLAVGAGVLLIR